MIAVANTELVMEKGGAATVRCQRCHKDLGRVQVRGSTRGEPPAVWADEVRGELEVLAAEHEPDCPAAPAHLPEPVATDLGEHREKP